MRKKYLKIKNLSFLIILFFILIYPIIVNAQNPYLERLEGVAAPAYGQTPGSPQDLISLIITIVLGFLGLIFLILIIIGGYQWLTSGGNEEKINHARDRIKHAVIGLIIIMVSYIITLFVISQLANITDW